MGNSEFFTTTASNTLVQLLKEWQQQPFRWGREVEFQAELGTRLSQVFTLQGQGLIEGYYGHGFKHFHQLQSFGRIGFEPLLHYLDDEQKRRSCHPDIVLWGDRADGRPADEEPNEPWPILWACEIKFWSSDKGGWDLEKLKRLLRDRRIQSACFVDVRFSPTAGAFAIEPKPDPDCRELLIYEVYTPRALVGAK
jgi:hypothetical protein